MDCIILAGGFGTRLQAAVPGLPKALAPIQGVPFLKLLVQQLVLSGQITQITLALGYLAGQIVEAFRGFSFPLEYSYENKPLGTGGAVKNALDKTKSDPILVLNGDTYVDLPFREFLSFHRANKADATLAYRAMDDASRFGTLELAQDGRVRNFVEKKHQQGLVSCGAYLLNRDVFKWMSHGDAFSLEKDVFPLLLQNRLFGFQCTGLFIDIGTPDSYSQSQQLLRAIL